MYTCACCNIVACCQENPEKKPGNCPMLKKELMDEAFQAYALSENHEFYIKSSELADLGYDQWPRLKETVKMCEAMGYKRVGLAFCRGLHKEAKIVDGILRRAGLEVVSVICKTGGIDKTQCGIPEESKRSPGSFDPMCNPIAQAMLLNEQKTQFNIALGLCVGHDSLFYKYSDALVTTLVAKDRVTGHNPAAAIYCAEGYFREKLL